MLSERWDHPRSVTPPHNPDVQPQRQGWCVYHEATRRFLAAEPEFGKPLEWGTAKDAHVFLNGTSAAYQVSVQRGCVLTTAPRWDGHCWSWSEGPAT